MRLLLIAMTALLAAGPDVGAGDQQPATTTISVEGMHCAGCAKSLTAKLKAVKSVQDVEVDLASKTAKITPMPSAKVSPKALWETVTMAGYKPTKLGGPAGTFTKTPDASMDVRTLDRPAAGCDAPQAP